MIKLAKMDGERKTSSGHTDKNGTINGIVKTQYDPIPIGSLVGSITLMHEYGQ